MTSFDRRSRSRLLVALTTSFIGVTISLGPDVALSAPIDDYNLAVKFFQQKRWALAADVAADFLKASPKHEKAPLARLYLGQSLAQQKKYAESRNVFLQFVQLHPDHKEVPLALYRIGECSHFLGNLSDAERELRLFVARHPNDELIPYAHLYLGETYLSNKSPTKAANAFRQAIARADVDTLKEDATFGLARAEQQLSRESEALKLYSSLVETNGRRAADALFALGSIYYRSGRYQEASKAFETFEEQFPGSQLLPTAQLNAGYTAYQLGDYEAARERFRAARQRPEQAMVADYWLALTSHAEGAFENSREAFQDVLANAPADAPEEMLAKSLFYLGDSQLRTDQFANALETFRKLQAAYPEASIADNAVHEATDAALRLKDYAAVSELNTLFDTHYSQSAFASRQKLLVARAAVEQVEADPADRSAIAVAESALQSLFGAAGGLDERARLELARLRQTVGRPADAIAAVEPLLNREGTADILSDARLLAASLYLESDEPTRTEELSKRVLRDTEGSSRPARELLARSQAALGRWNEAKATIDQLTDGAGKTAVLVDAAESAFAAEAWKEAAAWFQLAITDEAAPVAAFSGLGYSRFELQEFKAAADAFAVLEGKVLGNAQLGAAAAWMRGLSLQSANSTADAQRVFEAGVSSFAKTGEIEVVSGIEIDVVENAYQMAKQAARIARDANEADRSHRYYEIAVDQLQRLPNERRGDLDKLMNEWALLAYEEEDFERSDALFRKLLALTPNSQFADDASLFLAESVYFAGDTEAARTAFGELATAESSDPYVRERSSLLLIDIAAEEQDWAALKESSDRFISLFPQSESVLYATFRKGEALLRAGELKQAVSTLTTARDRGKNLDSTDAAWLPSVWVFLAEAAVQTRQYDLVESVGQEFVTRFPGSPLGYQIDEILGRSFKNRADFAKAREAFARVTDSEAGRRTETAAKSQFMIAETYLLEEKFSEALKEYYKVYVNYAFPEYQAPSLFQAAACDESMEQWSKAAETYSILIEEFPTSEFAVKAAPKLEAVKLRIP